MARRHKRSVDTPYSGFLLTFEPGRKELIDAKLRYRKKQASESFSAVDWKFEKCEAVLLALEPHSLSISGIALMRQMHGSGGTGKLKMRFQRAVMFDKPVESQRFSVPGGLTAIVSTAERLRRLPSKKWLVLIETLRRERPLQAADLDALLASRGATDLLTGDSNRLAMLAQQRDAVGTVIDIAGGDRGEVLGSLDLKSVDSVDSVLALLDHEEIHEQDAIRHDANIFGRLLGRETAGVAFKSEGKAIRIYVYDKKALETVIGIDLLIYQQAYRSFILLQYKMMKREQGKQGRTWVFAADGQMAAQIKAMDRAQRSIDKKQQPPKDLVDWRLHAQPFYWKFCESTRPTAAAADLLRGITLSLEHVQMFLASTAATGPRGGKTIGYDNCPRYLNNSQFIELAAGGWIGGGPAAYSFIEKLLLANNKKGGRQTLMAVIAAEEPLNARSRGRR